MFWWQKAIVVVVAIGIGFALVLIIKNQYLS